MACQIGIQGKAESVQMAAIVKHKEWQEAHWTCPP